MGLNSPLLLRMFYFNIISWLITILLVLLAVAFFTLFERKLIGLVHLRVGPNKVGYFGLLQPLLDAFKLLSKSSFSSLFSNKISYFLAPYLSLFLAILIWVFVPFYYNMSDNSFSLLAFLCVGSIRVFSILICGWSSNSKYSFIGSIRSIAQSISYERVFSTLVLTLIILFCTFSVKRVSSYFFIGLFYLVPLWIFSLLAETHRAPFDFSESESELVSGFNTEYRGSLFAFVFLSEYAVILVSCILFVWLFLNPIIRGSFMLIFISVLFSCLLIFIRVSFCRFRYDLLIIVAWKRFLPASLFIIIIYLSILSLSS